MTELRNIFLTVLVIVCSCSSPEEQKEVLSKDQMVEVMTEIHLLEAMINKAPIAPLDSSQAVYDHYEKKLFEELEITKEMYERSFNYYVDNPNEFEKIYGAVVDSLMKKENSYKK